MKVADYLREQSLEPEELSVLLGHKTPQMVRRYLGPKGDRREREMPKTWLAKLQGGSELSAGEPPLEAIVGEAEAIVQEELRRQQEAPTRPSGARIQAIPTGEKPLDLRALAGQIEGAYKLAAQTIRSNEPVLASVIDDHAHAAGEAWAKWIESEPKVAAFLQKMMVGTPLGEVIYVHVGIVFSYTLARSAGRQLAREAAEREAAAQQAAVSFDGPAEQATGDRLAGP